MLLVRTGIERMREYGRSREPRENYPGDDMELRDREMECAIVGGRAERAGGQMSRSRRPSAVEKKYNYDQKSEK
jgi:hypothetical protein